ncbi:putative endo-beta-1,4-glucanase D [Amylocarpus encephaloides]|uniref:AA9 family lytic polysaccharide monooxygenase n=1 Tax=Amylocarpus encephaloides TaxID=45428 RepID=A0A9P7YC23_9HELO|nr:putative endo-beta-1,4-glucanase D [Amylocarpus encephaloides]
MKSFISVLAFAPAVFGHSTFQELWVDGNSPVTSVSSNDIRCNTGTRPVASSCSVVAGQTITVEMHAQPGDRVCSKEAIGGNHYGPVMVYMSKVSSSKTDVGSGTWFKISEEGYNSATKKWGTDSLNSNCGKRDVVVPASLAPGDYLVRAEAIALHAAQGSGGAQFYMTCYQVTVTGSGTANPTGVKFPGAYNANDPGIKINIYQMSGDYKIPGPAVWTG